MNKLIKISDIHYIIVDDSEIKEGDWIWNELFKNDKDCIVQLQNCSVNFLNEINRLKYSKKITHSTQPETLGVGWMQSIKPLLLSEVEEVINGYSVEKMAESRFGIERNEVPHWKEYIDNDTLSKIKGYVEGFEAHQELVKDKLFTIEDVLSFLDLHTDDAPISYLKREFIKYSQPKTEWNISISENNKITLI